MNNKNTPILIPYEPEELKKILQLILRNELQTLKGMNEPADIYSVPGMTQKPLFKAWEVCKMLQISRQTLHTWTKDGLLKGYKIKSRLFFLWTDIEKLIKQERAT